MSFQFIRKISPRRQHMRNVLALGAAILLVGSVGVSIAQERLQTNQSGLGVGEGVGDVSGSSTRVTTFDRSSFLDRLSQAETIYGRVIGLDLPGKKMYLDRKSTRLNSSHIPLSR